MQEIFLKTLRAPLAQLLGLESEAFVSHSMDLSPVQDSFRYRAKYLGLRIASLVLDEQGELNRAVLEELCRQLSKTPFILGPGREGDCLLYRHIGNSLRQLQENREIWLAIRKFSPPLCHKSAEEIIRETLWPEPIRRLETKHVRKAVLAAWFTFLRQTTGCCFATAPAILVQQNEPLRFFKDLYDLLSLGQIKRVFGGKEYSVPLSFSSGVGDLQKVVSAPCFGMIAALETVGIKISTRAWEPQTVESYLRKVLLKEMGLTEEDLEDEAHLTQIQMTPLLARQGAVYYQKPSERAQRIAEWKKKLETVRLAFKTLTECALLRAWEYTLASLSDVKTEFARWNLYIGLGLHPDQKEGIGAFLYNQIHERFQKCHLEIEKLAREYEQEIGRIQAIEVMIQGALSDARLNQLKADWMSSTASANTIVEMRDRWIARAEGLSGFFSWLISRYDEKLQEQFQELFDPALARGDAHLYEDSPAGFRLVYKHGRTDASQWSAIHNKGEYIDALRDFFSRVENELELPPLIDKELMGEITTALIQFIRGEEFFKEALIRSREKGRLSPWDYISGGTLQTLLMAYCNRDRPFSEASLIPHSAEELFQFLKSQRKQALMHSPTHAFTFYPEFLEETKFSIPLRKQTWNEEMQEHIAHRLSERLPQEERALFLHLLRQKPLTKSNVLFRSHLIETLRIKNRETLVDSVLYENAHLMDLKEAKEVLRRLGKGVEIEGAFFSAADLFQILKMSILQSSNTPFFNLDWDRQIATSLRKEGLLPEAHLFGDTNWANWFFGFVQHPVLGHLELWRLNRVAIQGFPMTDWKEWLNPQNGSAWAILSNPNEYWH